MNNLMYLELTLENLKVIKLWHMIAMEHKQLTREDNEAKTKIDALVIAAREERHADLRLFRRSRE